MQREKIKAATEMDPQDDVSYDDKSIMAKFVFLFGVMGALVFIIHKNMN